MERVSPALAELLASCGTCVLWAEQDEGPYWRASAPMRRDLVEDRDGARLQLGLRLASQGGGPLIDATVEVWHCDSLGRYSGFPPPDPSVVATAATAPRGEYLPDQTFLRGVQAPDDEGMVEFRTIYPGWYPGRTVHIHLIVRCTDGVYTSQLYFPDGLSDEVLAGEPYVRRPDRDTTNATDEILPVGGDPAVLDVVQVGDGYRAAIRLLIPQEAAPP